jgi:hypothetical protein
MALAVLLLFASADAAVLNNAIGALSSTGNGEEYEVAHSKQRDWFVFEKCLELDEQGFGRVCFSERPQPC